MNSVKPLVFISCGQYNKHEVELGQEVVRLIRDETSFEAYFAEQQNTLEGLSSNILSALKRATAFIGIMHHRGEITTPSGDTIIRGSVWIEQEIAIAAFIQTALARQLEVVLYLQRGITREGIREQLRLGPIEFENASEVVADLRLRIGRWSLAPVNTSSLTAETSYELQHPYNGSYHPYKFSVELINNSTTLVDVWQIDLWFPSVYIEGSDPAQPYVRYTKSEMDYSPPDRRLWPGRRLKVFEIDYYINLKNWPGQSGWPNATHVLLPIRVLVSSADAPLWEREISPKDVQNY